MQDSVPVWASALTGALLLAAGGLVPYLVSRAARGELRRNTWAGIRTPGTLGSDAGWRAGHTAARRWAAAGGAVLGLGGLGALLVGALGGAVALFAAAAAAGALGGAALLVVGAARADAAARQVSRRAGG